MKQSEIIKFKRERFLRRNLLKKEILFKLNIPKTATDLTKELKRHRSAVSRPLLDLEKDKIVKCINPKDNMDRGYI